MFNKTLKREGPRGRRRDKWTENEVKREREIAPRKEKDNGEYVCGERVEKRS